ncbi:MAG TPA: hypothetical protein VH912_29535 [Streptosporangiaceae bacterium]|jgi:hypothetical protein
MRFRLAGPRRGALPKAVRDELALERGEHVIAHATTRDGSYVVATDAALHLPAPAADFVRLPWERIEQASWQNGWLHVRESGRAGEHHLRLTEPGSVPETVQERVTATIVVNHHATLPGGSRVRIVGRRPPAGDTIRWTFVFDAGLDPNDPGLRAQAEQVLETLRRQTGL